MLKKFILCKMLNLHDYYVITEYSHTVRKVGCRRCEGVWGMNDRTKSLIPWDGELEELHSDDIMTLGKFIKKYVEMNTSILLWYKTRDGHVRATGDGKPVMEWELLKSHWAKNEVLGITDIVTEDKSINIVIRRN